MKVFVVAVLIAVSGVRCAHDPYLRRTVSDDAGTHKYLFAYGKYCGPGYPADLPGIARLDRLTMKWPPADDLDAVCYAHDYCYLRNSHVMLCDLALLTTLGAHVTTENKRDDPRSTQCSNLEFDMFLAFNLKVGQTGSTGLATLLNTAFHLITLPLTAVVVGVTQVGDKVFGYPQEGTCNQGNVSDPVGAIHAFEQHFKDNPLNLNHQTIEVAIPATSAN